MDPDQAEADWTRGPGPDAVFAQFLAAGEFRIQCCEACGSHVFYPRLTCSHCGSVALRWVRPSGRGVVHASSTVAPTRANRTTWCWSTCRRARA